MLSLSDEELDVLFSLSAPIETARRDGFLRACAAELERYKELGPGLVFRVGKTLQREFLRVPAMHSGLASKYR